LRSISQAGSSRNGSNRHFDKSPEARREKRDEARLLLLNGIDPGALRKQTKLIATLGSGNTFGAIADEFIIKKFQKEGRSNVTIIKTRWLLTKFAAISKRPIKEITTQEILAALAAHPAGGAAASVKPTGRPDRCERRRVRQNGGT
jgi:hypothetical protein